MAKFVYRACEEHADCTLQAEFVEGPVDQNEVRPVPEKMQEVADGTWGPVICINTAHIDGALDIHRVET